MPLSRRNILLGLNALLAGVLAGLLTFPTARRRLSGAGGAIVTGRASIGGPFSLTDHQGRRVTDETFLGRHMLLLFGYTNCPDIGPAALQTVAAYMNTLGAAAHRITPVLITLDPDRDTPRILAAYVARFHPRLVGLTGSAEEIDAAAKAYKVHYERVTTGNRPGVYTIEHAGLIHLIDARGNFVTYLSQSTSVDALFQEFTKLL